MGCFVPDTLADQYKKNNQNLLHFLENERGFSQVRKKKVSQGERVTLKLEPGQLYYIQSGAIKVSFYDTKGNEKALYLAVSGEWLGISTFLESVSPIWEFSAVEPVELVVFPNYLLRHYTQEIYQFLSLNLPYYLKILSSSWQAMLSEGAERIRYALIVLSIMIGKSESESILLPSYVTQELIAQFASVTRSYVAKQLVVLEQKGVVQIRYREIRIIDMNELLDLTPNYLYG